MTTDKNININIHVMMLVPKFQRRKKGKKMRFRVSKLQLTYMYRREKVDPVFPTAHCSQQFLFIIIVRKSCVTLAFEKKMKLF